MVCLQSNPSMLQFLQLQWTQSQLTLHLFIAHSLLSTQVQVVDIAHT